MAICPLNRMLHETFQAMIFQFSLKRTYNPAAISAMDNRNTVCYMLVVPPFCTGSWLMLKGTFTGAAIMGGKFPNVIRI